MTAHKESNGVPDGTATFGIIASIGLVGSIPVGYFAKAYHGETAGFIALVAFGLGFLAIAALAANYVEGNTSNGVT